MNPKFRVYIGTAGKFSGHRLAYSVRNIKHGKNRGKVELYLVFAGRIKKVIVSSCRIIEEL